MAELVAHARRTHGHVCDVFASKTDGVDFCVALRVRGNLWWVCGIIYGARILCLANGIDNLIVRGVRFGRSVLILHVLALTDVFAVASVRVLRFRVHSQPGVRQSNGRIVGGHR